MELILRPEIQEFMRVCGGFVEFSHRSNGLTAKEREVVIINFLHALDKRVIPTPP